MSQRYTLETDLVGILEKTLPKEVAEEFIRKLSEYVDDRLRDLEDKMRRRGEWSRDY